MTAIQLDGLGKAFGRQRVLDDLTLAVRSGELLALLGPSGSGKSTILKLIAGIEEPDRGDVRFDGASIANQPAHRRGAVLMFQSAYLFPFLNVAENIGFGLKVQGVSQQRRAAAVAQMLDLVELPGIERSYPRQLSGGQAQRVALARALVVKPQVLMLDEPLSNLDPHIRQSLQATIRRIQRELQITTLLVTHDLGEALAMSDRTALLLNGRIAALDTPTSLFNRPPTRAAAQFVGVSAFFSGQLRADVLDTAAGPIRVAGVDASQDTAGRHATFAIRPEHIGLLTSPAPTSLAATIGGATYRGEHTEYSVEVGELRFKLRSTAHHGLMPGDPAFVQLPPEHLFEVAD